MNTKKGHPHAVIAQQFWAEMAEDDQAYLNWEVEHNGGVYPLSDLPVFRPVNTYRKKKRKITINGVEINAPEVEKPHDGATYYVPSLSVIDKYETLHWKNDSYDYRVFNRGLVFLNKEDAIAMTEASLKPFTDLSK